VTGTPLRSTENAVVALKKFVNGPRFEGFEEEVGDRILDLSSEPKWAESTDGLGRKVRWQVADRDLPLPLVLNWLSADLQIPVAQLRRWRNAALRRAKEGR
jgi:hypothetical protein